MLRDIWEDENAFSWRRNFTKDKLTGSCRICTYGSKCLGGCPNTRLTMNGDIYSENQYCAYHLELEKKETQYASYDDAKELLLLGEG